MTWHKTDRPGVTYMKHDSRKHGVQKDRYFRGQYQVGGKRKTIGFGWMSEGWSAEKVFQRIQQYRHNAKVGEGPTTLKEEREQAEERKRQEETERQRLEKLNVTFSQFFQETYLPQAQADKKEGSWKKEQSFFNKWINPQFGDKALRDVTPSDLEALKERMTKAGSSPRSIQYCLAVVRQVFNRAIALDVVDVRNPVNKVKIPSPNNKRTRFLSFQEAQALLSKLAEHSQDLHDIALVSLHCGLRAGEIFSLRWQSRYFDQGTIPVRDAKANKDRYAYMTRAVRDMLEGRKGETSRQDLVFPSKKGGQRKLVSKVFHQAVNEVGLNEGVEDRRDLVSFHTLRHTFASWQVQAGMSLYELQRLLGHESFSMVQRYAHLAPENLQRATAIFDQQDTKGQVIPFQ